MYLRNGQLVPSRRRVLLAAAAASLTGLCLASCRSQPARIEQPRIDPARAGKLAMEQYDTNGDGLVAGDELDHAPGLKAALARIDANGDGAISAAEVAERIRIWQGTRLGLMPFTLVLTLDGRPLEGATVTFEPEKFLGDEIQSAITITDEFGGGGPSIPKALRPDPERTPPGVQLGIYQVKISRIVNGKETIPHKYNEETTLGQEVAPDVPEIGTMRVVYAISTR